jgi:FAD/FMN-containing dehydrogenase
MKYSPLIGAVLFAAPGYSELALRPPAPDKALTANATTAPAGCKLLASDKGWPSDEEWLRALPGAFKKLKGTLGPDWSVQPSTPAEVQAAVNFAREKNVRLTIVSSGHDFHGR